LASSNQPAGIIDLGGTKIYSAIVAADGSVRGEDLRPTNAMAGQAAVIGALGASLRSAAASAAIGLAEICGVGVAAPGPVDAASGHLTNPPNLPGWGDVPLGTILASDLGIPVLIENDANAAALGEYFEGAGRGARALIFVTVSTGIGGGIVLNGELYRGLDGAAGELGHIIVQAGGPRCGCGNLGCLEAVASGTALAREGLEALRAGNAPILARLAERQGGDLSAETVAQAAAEGDVEAAAVLQRAGEMLGIGLGSLVNLLNPDVIVIGGGTAKIGAPLLGPAEATMREIAFPLPSRRVEVRTAELEYPALHGLAGLVRARSR